MSAKKQLTVSIGQCSQSGRKPVNQDFYGVLVPNGPQLSSKGIAIAIADGISSSDVSQVASETAVKGFLSDYYCTSDTWSVKTSAVRVLSAMNSWLYAQTRHSLHRYNKDKGYVSTFSAIVFKSNTAHLFHCGDSRIYRLSDSSLELLTTDHRHRVSEETCYLTRALGIHDTLEMDYRQVLLSKGDTFLLATDGVYDFLPDSRWSSELNHFEGNLDKAAEQLVEAAYTAGSHDNLTLQIIRIDELPDRHFEEMNQLVSELPSAPVLKARMTLDGYEIIREVYISSRSHVFLAKDLDTQQQVIIKTPSTEMRENEAYLERFLMEDWIAKRINNAHVLKAIDPVRKRNYIYTVTEFIEGQTLVQWMIDNPAPDIETVRHIVEQIAKGLQAFHRQEMVHQDLRPNNIMIDTTATIKIIDFGATKVAGISEISKRNEGILGTAQYTAPEYFLGEQGSSRSDIFSLGVIAYQMLSNRLPYGIAISKANSVRSQQRLAYRSLLIEGNNIPGWVDYAIQKSVNINPLKRYAEVAEFVYDLRKPSPHFLSKSRPPLIERNPVLFWQWISLVLLGVIVFQNIPK